MYAYTYKHMNTHVYKIIQILCKIFLYFIQLGRKMQKANSDYIWVVEIWLVFIFLFILSCIPQFSTVKMCYFYN